MFIEINKLSIKLNKNNRELIKDLSFSVCKNDKIAIIGEEGDGKSSIIKCIADLKNVSEYAIITGKINTFGSKVGYLPQKPCEGFENLPVIEYFLRENPQSNPDYEIYNEFHLLIKYFDLFGLDKSMIDDERKIQELSGGEKVKLNLLKILLKMPDVLVFDEPTNDIDIQTIIWLENFIRDTNLPVLYVSHDEELLSRTANAILHIEQLKKKTQNKWTFVKMSYDDYIQSRLHLLERERRIALNEKRKFDEKQRVFNEMFNKVQSDLRSVSRQDPHGARLLAKKMKSVKSQEKKMEIEKNNMTQLPDVEESIFLKFTDDVIDKNTIICDLKIDKLQKNNKLLTKNIDFLAYGMDKIAIIGKNGIGKTTFLQNILNNLKYNPKLKVGYMPQDYDGFLSNYDSALDFVSQNMNDKEKLTKVQTYLGALKFTRDEMNARIQELSGGSKAKLFLAKIMAEECNVLVLDEPTRNLSPLSNPVIRNALANFKGAIISVSHDRKFLKDVATKVYRLDMNGLEDVSSNFKNV